MIQQVFVCMLAVAAGRGPAAARAGPTSRPAQVTVLLAHWAPPADAPAQARRAAATADIPAKSLTALGKRLAKAGLRLAPWDLNQDMPGSRHRVGARVLLVVPPPPAAPQPPGPLPKPPPRFAPQHAAKVTAAIDRGTPALFLAAFSPPRQVGMSAPPTQCPYAWGDYLREKWGINVMTDYLVVPAVAAPDKPGRFKIDAQRFAYLPLRGFSDHPIGKPLRKRRMLWTNLCPIARTKDARGKPGDPPAGVKIEPLLTVPADQQATWATRRIPELIEQFRSEESLIWPDYEAGDLRVPFDVAVAATRAADKRRGLRAARIVVVGTGQSLTDGYLDREVAVRDADGTIRLTDPPWDNAELVVNSIYWLIRRPDLIAKPAGGAGGSQER